MLCEAVLDAVQKSARNMEVLPRQTPCPIASKSCLEHDCLHRAESPALWACACHASHRCQTFLCLPKDMPPFTRRRR